MEFNGKKVLVLGYGVEGKSAVDFLIGQNSSVTVYDKKDASQFPPEDLNDLKQKGITGAFGGDIVPGDFDFAIRSPGISFETPVVKDLVERGIKVTSTTNIFMSLCQAPVIGVTGTKGKGTTSALIYEMLLHSGKNVLLGGNIGTAPLLLLDKLQPDSIVVLEMSSFQLEDLAKSPHIAVVLMVTSDHMDYHKDQQAYINAKAGLVKAQTEKDFLVFNADYPNSLAIAYLSPAIKYGVSSKSLLTQGCFIAEGSIVIAHDSEKKVIANVKDVRLLGEHNLENVCAATMSAYLGGASKEGMLTALKKFRGLEHRLEFVTEISGIKYYNDSFATNPESTVAAISAFKEPKVLILGGSGKGSDFSELAQTILNTDVRAIIGIGKEWFSIKEAIAKIEPKPNFPIVEGLVHMDEIVREAKSLARPGDVVLLSPACASFGLFKDYKERGQQFKDQVIK